MTKKDRERAREIEKQIDRERQKSEFWVRICYYGRHTKIDRDRQKQGEKEIIYH